MFRFVGFFCVSTTVLLGGISAFGQRSSSPSEFSPGTLRSFGDLPLGRFRRDVERLPAPARDRAMAWLASFHFTELDLDSLHVDPAGGVFYADIFDLAPSPIVSSVAFSPVIASAPVPVSPFPASLAFHSRPGAPNVIFLNFSGEDVSNTAWNSSLGRTSIPAVAYSTDADFSTFTDAEQLAVKRIWQRVSEDYAPFNIDVTTERPASFGNRTAHALITRNTDANGQNNPAATAGGVGYVDVFGSAGYASYRPVWVYFNNLAFEESYIAEAASHEIGHNMGLSHDGATDGRDYYGGHGSGEISWGPIMGTGYGQNVSQWSKGEYYLANNTQDDLATIAAKLSYRADDHGNTAAAATALVITQGTQVLATTSENDPAHTNSANKGVLERASDVDVFSFATGAGAIDLTVNPWIMLSGLTRGGNLDVLVELHDASGILLLTNNPSTQTGARIQANLTEGVYYLWVRDSGAGNPTNTLPSGYTSYGSIGQYFITGSVVQSSIVIPPGAALQITDISQPGAGSKQFTVVYSDNVGIAVSTIDNNDVTVTGPNGYARGAGLIAVDSQLDGTPRVATYAIDPPAGGTWIPGDNGVYHVWVSSNQVSDVEGAWVAEGELGQFQVNVPRPIYFASMDANPGWTFEGLWQYGQPLYPNGGPTAGFTGANIVAYNLTGNYENRLPLVFATTPVIDCSGSSSLTLRFQRWLRLKNGDNAVIQVTTNGTSWADVWSTSKPVGDTAWQEVQYALPGWVAGSSSVRLRWGIASGPAQNDIGWNIDDVQLLGDGALDTTAPLAVLNAANVTAGGSPTHSFTVTYSDDSAVRVASLGSSDLVVIGPNGYSNAVEFVGADLPADGTPRTATYSVSAPGGSWDAADNGTYQVILQNGEVTDTSNNAIPEAALGAFTVAIVTNQQALVVSAAVLTIPEGTNGVFMLRLAEQPSANVTVTIVQVAGSSNILQGAFTNVFTPLNWASNVPVVMTALVDADQTNDTATFECRSEGLAPVSVLVTQQDLTPDNTLTVTPNEPLWGTVNPTNGSYPVGAWIEVTAQPSNYFRFMNWTGSYPSTNNPLTIMLETNVVIQAVFAEIVTTNHATPYWWLAAHGFAQDFEMAELKIGANGLPLWQSFVAGLNPDDPSSQLRLRIESGIDPAHPILRWQPVAGRLYTLLQSGNLLDGFAPIDGASDLPPTIKSITNVLTGPAPAFYRLEVRKP